MKKTLFVLCAVFLISLGYSPNATHLWNVTYNGGNDDTAYGMTTDSSGNVYVIGESNNGADFDFIFFKYNSSGNHTWNITYDSGNGDDRGNAIAVDSSGNVYATGHFNNSVDYDMITFKYNSSGSQIWNVTYDSGNGEERGGGIDVDASGNVYAGGYFDNGANRDFIIFKYNSSGSQIWNTTYNSGFTDTLQDLAIDSSLNVYVVGSAHSTTSYKIIKYNSSGSHLWNITYDSGASNFATSVTTDSSGNVYTTGSTFTSSFIFLSFKYNSSGSHLWNVTYDQNTDFGYGIAVDSSQNVYVTGFTDKGAEDALYMFKYDSSGTYLYNITYDTANNDRGYGVDVDSSGNVYLAGRTNNGANDDIIFFKYSQPSTSSSSTASVFPLMNPYLLLFILGAFIVYRAKP